MRLRLIRWPALVLLLGAGIVLAPRLFEPAVQRLLADRGIAADFRLRLAGFDRIVLEDLRVTAPIALRIARAEATVAWQAIDRRPQLLGLHVKGLDLVLDARTAGPSATGPAEIKRLIARLRESWPDAAVSLDDARLVLQLADGAVLAAGDLRAGRDPDGTLRFIGERLELRHALARLQVDNARLEIATDDELALELEVADGVAQSSGVAVERLSGRLAARGQIDQPLPAVASTALHGTVMAPAWLAGETAVAGSAGPDRLGLDLTAWMAPGEALRVSWDGPWPPTLDGRGRLQLGYDGELSRPAARLAARVSALGGLQGEAHAAAWATATPADLLAAAARAEAGAWQAAVATLGTATASVRGVARGGFGWSPLELSALAGQLTAEARDGDIHVSTDGPLSLTLAGDAKVALSLAGDATVGPQGRIAARLTAAPAADARIAGWRGSLQRFDANLVGDAAQGVGRIELAGSVSPPAALAAPARLDELALAGRLALQWRNGVVSLRPEGCLAGVASGLGWPGRFRAEPLRFCLLPDAVPLLAVPIAAPQRITLEPTLRLDRAAFHAEPAGNGQISVEGIAASGRWRIVADGSPRIDAVGKASIERFDAPALGLAGRGGTVAFAAPLDRPANLRAKLKDIRWTACAGCLAPLRATGLLTFGPELSFRARLGDRSRKLTVQIEGRHQTASGRGEATARLAPVLLGVAPKLAAIVPAARPDDRLTATVLGGLRLDWGDGVRASLDLVAQGVEATLPEGRFKAAQVALGAAGRLDAGAPLAGRVLVDNLRLEAFGVTARQINTVLELDRLWPWPPRTAMAQQVTIGALELGLPLTDGVLRFRLSGDGGVAVETAGFACLGGSVGLEPFAWTPGQTALPLELTVAGIDLGQLLAAGAPERISGEGRLDGRVPLRIDAGGVVIEGGRITAQAPGKLGYRTAAGKPSGIVAELSNQALAALRDFDFQSLSFGLDGRLDGKVRLKGKLRGSSAVFYRGHPVELDVRIGGNLGQILRAEAQAYEIPETMRQRMRAFGEGR